MTTTGIQQIQSSVRLLYKLVVRCMEDKVIGTLGGELLLLVVLGAVVLLVGQLVSESIVDILQCPVVAHLTEGTIHSGILDGVIGFEEVPNMGGMSCALRGIDHGQRRISTDQDGHCTGATCWSGISSGVGGNVGGDDDGIAAIPPVAFHPGKGVEEGGRTAVAGVDDGGTLDVGVGSKQLHQHGFGRLGLVHEGFGANFESAHLGFGIDAILLEEGVHHGERYGVDVLGIAGDANAILAEPDGVSAGGCIAVLLEIGLRYIGGGSVDLDGQDANVFAVAMAAGGGACIVAGRRGSGRSTIR